MTDSPTPPERIYAAPAEFRVVAVEQGDPGQVGPKVYPAQVVVYPA